MGFEEIISWVADNPYLAAVLIAAILLCLAGIIYLLVRYLTRPLILFLIMNLFVHLLTYVLPRSLPISYTFHDLTTALDRLTPFFPPMSVIYLLAFLQWAVYWILLCRESKDLRSRFLAGEWISKFLCMIVFILYPTTLVRPNITGTGVFDRLTTLVYLIDAPNNLLPSVHCLMSWFCLRGSFRFQNTPKWYFIFNLIFSPLVFLSTIMVRQHVWLDVPTAILAAEAGLILARATHLDTAFAGLENALSRKA